MKLSLVIALGLAACAASLDQKQDAAGASYAADQADCVRISKTRDEADACRAARRSMWDAGIDSEAGK